MRNLIKNLSGARKAILALLVSAIPVVSQAAEQTIFYHLDALGSPIAATDEGGNLLWREEYRPYGEKIQNDPASTINSRAFTGHPHDDTTGLTYAGARHYDPVVGRFMGVDAAPFAENNIHSFNRYVYGNNNPYRYADPDGNLPVLIIPILVGTGLITLSDYANAPELGQAPVTMSTGERVSAVQGALTPVRGVGSAVANVTSREARREVMRQQGIPTSQQPVSQSKSESGREYRYEVPKAGGGTQTKSVQDQTLDRSHPGQGHWEAGTVKTGRDGEIRTNQYGMPKLESDKSKVFYDQ